MARQPVRERPRNLLELNKVRTQHGTRVARRIKCSSCGGEDTVDFAPRDPKTILCRRCAFEQRGIVDPDDKALREKRQACGRCGRWFDLPYDPTGESRPICADCKAGIETKQQDRSKDATRVSRRIVKAKRKD
jgi:CxxC-x17-CxxC domain-containing protein